MRFGSALYVIGAPADEVSASQHNRPVKAWEQITRWLYENEYHVQGGIVAMHQDSTLFNSHMRSPNYDKENDCFILRESGEEG